MVIRTHVTPFGTHIEAGKSASLGNYDKPTDRPNQPADEMKVERGSYISNKVCVWAGPVRPARDGGVQREQGLLLRRRSF